MNVLPPVEIPASGLVAEVTIPSPATAVTLLNQSSFSITVSNFGGKSFYMSSGKEMTLPWNGQSGSFNVAGVSNSTAGTMLVTYYQSGDNPLPTGVVGPLVDISGQTINIAEILAGNVGVSNTSGTVLSTLNQQVLLLSGTHNITTNTGTSLGFSISDTVHAIAGSLSTGTVTNPNAIPGLAASTSYGISLQLQVQTTPSFYLPNQGDAIGVNNYAPFNNTLLFYTTTDASGEIPAGTVWTPQVGLGDNTIPPTFWIWDGVSHIYLDYMCEGDAFLIAGTEVTTTALPNQYDLTAVINITGYQGSEPQTNKVTIGGSEVTLAVDSTSSVKGIYLADSVAPADNFYQDTVTWTGGTDQVFDLSGGIPIIIRSVGFDSASAAGSFLIDNDGGNFGAGGASVAAAPDYAPVAMSSTGLYSSGGTLRVYPKESMTCRLNVSWTTL